MRQMLRSHRVRVGGLDHMEAQSCLPKGARTTCGLVKWPVRALDTLLSSAAGPGKGVSLAQLCEHKMRIDSYYTCKGSEGTLAMHFRDIFRRASICNGEGVLVCASCGPQPRKMYKHAFGNISERFLREHLRHLSECAPKATLSAETRRIVDDAMQSYLSAVVEDGDKLHRLDENGRPVAHCFVEELLRRVHDHDWESAIDDEGVRRLHKKRRVKAEPESEPPTKTRPGGPTSPATRPKCSNNSVATRRCAHAVGDLLEKSPRKRSLVAGGSPMTPPRHCFGEAVRRSSSSTASACRSMEASSGPDASRTRRKSTTHQGVPRDWPQHLVEEVLSGQGWQALTTWQPPRPRLRCSTRRRARPRVSARFARRT